MGEEEATGEPSGQRDCRPTEGRCPNEKEKFRVNRKLLPIKIFYFMSNAGESRVKRTALDVFAHSCCSLLLFILLCQNVRVSVWVPLCVCT